MAASCTSRHPGHNFWRPFEISFDEALGEDEYAKLKKKMEKKLEKIRGKD